MDTTTILKQKRAFTIIELTIAIAVVAILASLVSINFSQSRKNARDGVRKTDAPAILAAVSQYVQANGSSLIRLHDAQGNPSACTVSSDSSEVGVGIGCVGANGRGYGKINVAGISGTAAEGVGREGSTVVRREYPSNGSIVDALVTGGYFDIRPRDPLSKNKAANDITARDYALIRACPNGEQHVGSRGQLFAVWTVIENRLTTSDLESIRKLPGRPTPRGLDNYVYDFAAGTDLLSGNEAFDTTGYGVGNASAVGSITSANQTCSPGA